MPFSLACISGLVLLAANGLAFPVGANRLRRIMVYLGDRSYTLYLFHPPALIVAFVVVWKWMHWAIFSTVWFGILEAGVTLAVATPVCHLIYRFIEMPCIRLFSRKTAAGGHGPTISVSPRRRGGPRRLPGNGLRGRDRTVADMRSGSAVASCRRSRSRNPCLN